MDEVTQTFPTIRRWRRMSEDEQDALLDTIESRRRRRGVTLRLAIAVVVIGVVAAAAWLVLAA